MITNVVSDNLEEVSFKLSEDNIIAGPWIVTDALWKNGKFTTVGRRPISDSEKLLDVGFYRIEYIPDGGTLKESGYLVDLHGNRIEQEPVYIHSCGYITKDILWMWLLIQNRCLPVWVLKRLSFPMRQAE